MGLRVDAAVGLRTAVLLRGRFFSCASGLIYFARHHPKQRHWYLQMLGTEPASQGKGLGSSMITGVLDRCDRDGESAYLEASKEDNVPFYMKHGFVVSEEMHIPRGPTVWAMWREPH